MTSNLDIWNACSSLPLYSASSMVKVIDQNSRSYDEAIAIALASGIHTLNVYTAGGL